MYVQVLEGIDVKVNTSDFQEGLCVNQTVKNSIKGHLYGLVAVPIIPIVIMMNGDYTNRSMD